MGGFVSRLDSKHGSVAIYAMFRKFVAALDKGQSPFVHEVFDAVQTELHEAGKQMPECTWNDDTRYMVFKKNVNSFRIENLYEKKENKKNGDEAIAADLVETNDVAPEAVDVSEEPVLPQEEPEIIYSPQSIEMTSHQ